MITTGGSCGQCNARNHTVIITPPKSYESLPKAKEGNTDLALNGDVGAYNLVYCLRRWSPVKPLLQFTTRRLLTFT